MKTTVEITDLLLTDAKQLAYEQKTTLRVLIEEGLRKVVAERREQGEKNQFKLRNASVEAGGVRPGVDLSKIRDQLYEEYENEHFGQIDR